MDWRTFFAECLRAVAWPTAAVVMLVLLRQPIAELLKQTRRFKYQEMEVEFDREITAASSELGADGAPVPKPAEFQRIAAAALEEPPLAVVDAWREVEAALVRFAKRQRLDAAPGVWTMPLVLIALLLVEDKLSQSQHDVIARLKSLRDRVTEVPGFTVTAEEALKYVDLAARVVATLDEPETAAAQGRAKANDSTVTPA